jgi:ABC-2 type transport system permease protein
VALIAANDLRRLVRQRSNLFFVFLLPLMLIVVLGSTVSSGSKPRIGVVATGTTAPLTRELLDGLGSIDGARTTVYDDLDEPLEQLRREELTAVVVIPDDYDQRLSAGESVQLEYLVIPGSRGFEIQGIVRSVVADQNEQLRAARLLAGEAGDSITEALAVTRGVAGSLELTRVVTVDEGGDPFTALPAFDQVASQEVILFMFLTSMTAAAAIIQVRRLGLARRMLSTPASPTEVLAGQALGRYGLALIQSLFIIGATALLFGIDWYSWPATLAIVATFGLIATAAAMLIGSVATNESQSTAVGLALGLSTAAFGGCMVPLEVFPDALRTAAHVTPHAWANDAFATLQRGGGLPQVAPELAVLGAYGVALLAIGTAALSRSITR